MNTNYNCDTVRYLLEDNLAKMYAVLLNEANIEQIYKASAITVNDILRKKRREYNNRVKERKGKRVYYLCMEFLMGRSLKNNLYNLELVDTFSDILKTVGCTLEDLYEKEPDAGLGNGGLGRLGACYMDALASCGYPAMGFSIRYEYGLFRQRIVDGWQTELPDVWLPGGEVWLTQRSDKVFKVRYGGWVEEKHIGNKKVYEHKDYREIEAVPYDMMVSGADSEAVSVLRLWRSRNIEAFDIHSFSQGDYIKAMKNYNEADLLSKVLYPADEHYEGKTLRIKQQYLLVSASIQNILDDHIRYYGDIQTLPKHVSIHINDTHPALCAPELLRLLIDEHGLTFDESWTIMIKTITYTNHTILSEALEKWSEDLIRQNMPRIHGIIGQINERFLGEIRCKGASEEDIRTMSIFGNNNIRMANLSVVVSNNVNGVSALHSEIIKQSVFKDFYKYMPDKFNNVTNGVAYRRWLVQSNPLLVGLLEKKIGHGYYKNADELIKLMEYINDDEILEQISVIKYKNKCEFSKFLYKKTGIAIDPTTRFDVHVKRLHEYKRQLLNVLKIIAILIELEDDPQKNITPQTFIFGAKAAPSYYAAKQVIELISCLSMEINKRAEIRSKLNVVFVEDYCVTVAEKLMPASEVSQQISLAGKEASGTGNMKFMLNGAITLGTLDGANIEINEAVGNENIVIFGMKANEVEDLWRKGYYAKEYYHNDSRIKRVLNRLDSGFNGKSFSHIKKYLLENYPIADPYMCLADFNSYMEAHEKMDHLYMDKRRWNQMSLMNIANAGVFSADRSIKEYAENIWNLKIIK